jgi:2-polyprenyl-3-methyl-5-hydroxy-6-metoxy-1,4-benzoquinol methylase
MQRIVRHYWDPGLRGYVWGKLRSDPIFAAAFELLNEAPTLPLLDVGCGIGLFEFYLRERGLTAPLTGVDFDKRKIASAQRVAKRGAYPDLTFTLHDAMTSQEFRGHVVIFDVLHYLDAAQQARLLERAASQIAPGGYCLIRDTLRDASWRFRVTQAEEFILRAVTWLKSGVVHYPTTEEISAPFRARGFSSEVRPLWGRTPFNSYLFTFRAPAV